MRNDVNGRRKLLRPADLLLASAIIALSVFGFLMFRSGEGKTAVIEYNGKTVRTIDLSLVKEQYSFEIAGDLAVEITVSPEGIWFSKSECRDKLCIQFGRLKNKGEMAACLPARVSVRISGGSADKIIFDGITG